MFKKLIPYILVAVLTLGICVLSYFAFLKKEPQVIISTAVIKQEQPVFRLAAYQINYDGKIKAEGSEKWAGSYNVFIEYEAEVLIGTSIHPKITLYEGVVELDMREVVLEVIAITPKQLNLINASTSTWRWILGKGIPIQDGLFEPIMAVFNDASKFFEDDPEIMERAELALIFEYQKFYTSINYVVNVIK